MSDLMNDKGVCRTAPATPGLLNINGLDITTTTEFFLFLNVLSDHYITYFLSGLEIK